MFPLSNQKQKSRGFELQKPQKSLSNSLFQFVASIYSLRLRNEVLQQLGADLITRQSANWAKHCDTGQVSGTRVSWKMRQPDLVAETLAPGRAMRRLCYKPLVSLPVPVGLAPKKFSGAGH